MIGRVTNLFKTMRWTPIPIYIGVGFIGYQGFRISKNRLNQPLVFDNLNQESGCQEPTKLEISLLKLLPLRIASRVWGAINSIDLPPAIREPILRAYSKAFNCDLSEAEIEDLKEYKNLQQFFTRSLKPNIRPVAEQHPLTSPSDGTIINLGAIDDHERVEQVKGANYSLSSFFGPTSWLPEEKAKEGSNYTKKLLHNDKDNKLYQCTIYLAPGDYHRFHSPVDWHVKFRRHFSGKLFSVNPSFANWIHGLFQLNERVIYVGDWLHGFFSITAIGATNVGSVKIYFDKDLSTNKPFCKKYVYRDKIFEEEIVPIKGEPFGEFNLGSTLVLIFEAPKDFKFNVKLGQKIKYGEPISFEE